MFTLSLMVTTPAFADEATPPEEPVVTEQGSGEENIVVEEAITTVETEAGDEATPSVETGESSSQETVAEILEQLPVDTEVIVVDENGEALPLTTEAAEEAIIVKDPIWCPAGIAPKPGIGGCSGSFTNLSLLVAGFIPPAKNGVIWIEFGEDDGIVDVVIDGAGTWAPAANYSLTLQGGWIGAAGPPVGSGAIVGTTVFDTAISIVNWNGAVTINDISFDGANNTANPGTGSLYVETTKNIVVSNVMAIESAGASNDGIYLDNTSSTTQATITVKNSTFNNNNFRGASILSDGAVTLTNVSAHFNNNMGVYINNTADSTASVVSVTKSFFNQNGGTGLSILSNGAVKLSQITASTNFGSGVNVDNNSTTPPQAVTVSSFLIANSNFGNGLNIQSKGTITLTNITTDGNGVIGTEINNSLGGSPYAVVISGFNSMSGNFGTHGLKITSLRTVTLNNITANSNSGIGTEVNNTGGTLPYAVVISGINSFSLNGNQGLLVTSRGAITTNNITGTYNGVTSDAIGVNLSNNYDSLKPQNITMNGVNTINFNGYTGLWINTYGAVTLNNINASFNGNFAVNNNGDGVRIYNSGGTLARPVTLKGTNVFNQNDYSGLEIYSLGVISIANITASNNSGGYGAYLNNQNVAFQSAVTISGYGVFNYNDREGLSIESNGAVTTTNLSATSNDGNGVYINTIGLTKVQAVNIKGNNTFIGNGNGATESGLKVFADGNITISNLTASQNYHMGALLDNFTNWNTNTLVSPGSVTITGFGNFHNNLSSGLYIYTKGNATLSYITANQNINNDGVGIYAYGKVNLTCVLVTDNNYGLWMYNSATTLTIKGLSSVGNSSSQEYLLYTTLIRSRCTG